MNDLLGKSGKLIRNLFGEKDVPLDQDYIAPEWQLTSFDAIPTVVGGPDAVRMIGDAFREQYTHLTVTITRQHVLKSDTTETWWEVQGTNIITGKTREVAGRQQDYFNADGKIEETVAWQQYPISRHELPA